MRRRRLRIRYVLFPVCVARITGRRSQNPRRIEHVYNAVLVYRYVTSRSERALHDGTAAPPPPPNSIARPFDLGVIFCDSCSRRCCWIRPKRKQTSHTRRVVSIHVLHMRQTLETDARPLLCVEARKGSCLLVLQGRLSFKIYLVPSS